MNVLIATNRLISFTGSEVIALEVGEAFRARGHPPLLFANAVSEEFLEHAKGRGLEVSWEQLPALASFDVVWSQHFVLPLLVDGRPPAAGTKSPFTVFMHLSPYEPYEAAVPVVEDLFAHAVFANSPETRAALLAAGIAPERVKVFPNPAPSAFERDRASPSSALSRLLVITNHMPPELKEALGILEGEAGLRVRHIGDGGLRKRVLPEDLGDCDALVTIGKSTQYALLARVPVYCYDIFGGPGWLNAAHFAKAEYYNFSGRCCGRKLAARDIAAELISGFAPAARFIAGLDRRALDRFVLEPYIDFLVDAASRRQPLTAGEARRISRAGHQLGRVCQMAAAIRREVATVETARRQLQEDEAALAEAQRLVAERDALVGQYAEGLARAQELVHERDAEVQEHAQALAEAQRLVAERDALLHQHAGGLARAEELVRQRDAELKEHAQALAEAQRLVAERDALLERREAELNERAKGLDEARRLAAHWCALSSKHEQELHQLRADLVRMQSSLSWRGTAPFRWLGRLFTKS